MIAWIYLVIAGLLEVAWAICLKQSEGFSRQGDCKKLSDVLTSALAV